MRQLLLDITEIGPPSLDNFVPNENEELLYTLRNLVAGNRQDHFYYLWGSAGCGKSHLLRAAADAFSEQQRNALYVDCSQTDEFNFNSGIDCLLIDNVEQLNNSAQIKLFSLYNQIRENGVGIFLASGPKPPAQLNLRQDLATRLGWGLVYQVHELTDEKKIEVMQDYAIRCGFELSLEICSYLLKHKQRDLSSLIKLVNALDQLSLTRKRPVTLPLLRELL
jgi:DnaA family protein